MSDAKKTLLRRVSKKRSPIVLGYTRTGKPVLVPKHSPPEVADRHVRKEFADWSRGDHADASKILLEHGEREGDPKIASRCTKWSSLHWDMAGRSSN